MGDVPDKSVEKINMPFLCSITFPKNCAIYEIMWKNMLDPNGPQMTI
jgi:hypothetical protein